MAEKFEAWGIVELMGRQRVAGRISEQPLGGGNLLRCKWCGESFVPKKNPNGGPAQRNYCCPEHRAHDSARRKRDERAAEYYTAHLPQALIKNFRSNRTP